MDAATALCLRQGRRPSVGGARWPASLDAGEGLMTDSTRALLVNHKLKNNRRQSSHADRLFDCKSEQCNRRDIALLRPKH